MLWKGRPSPRRRRAPGRRRAAWFGGTAGLPYRPVVGDADPGRTRGQDVDGAIGGKPQPAALRFAIDRRPPEGQGILRGTLVLEPTRQPVRQAGSIQLAASPFSNRQHRMMIGQQRAHRQRPHGRQRIPEAAGMSWIRDIGQGLSQAVRRDDQRTRARRLHGGAPWVTGRRGTPPSSPGAPRRVTRPLAQKPRGRGHILVLALT
jgi:hypothetical protein